MFDSSRGESVFVSSNLEQREAFKQVTDAELASSRKYIVSRGFEAIYEPLGGYYFGLFLGTPPMTAT